MTPEQYLAYLENQTKTSKFEHDGLEPHEVKYAKFKTKRKIG